MNKEYTSLGLMSGTSGDGVDASIILSDGNTKFEVIKDKYFEYDNDMYCNIHSLKEKIQNTKDLEKLNKELKELERNITLFHAKIFKELNKKNNIEIIGFHGQTILHSPQNKISKQIGDGQLLSQLAKKDIVYDFRQNDIENGGEGAPLTPIFHEMITVQKKIDLPLCILNIGGISNVSIIKKKKPGSVSLISRDIGPGNCLIDSWIRKNSEKKFDLDGLLAERGNKNEIILEQAIDLFSNRPNQNSFSLDVNDFDVSFARGLSLEDGASTLTDFTAKLIGEGLEQLFLEKNVMISKILICGGGRKNQFLIKKIKENLSHKIIIQSIDNYGINGDFVESQAFAFLAVRSIKQLPISYPETTGCSSPTTGGKIIYFR